MMNTTIQSNSARSQIPYWIIAFALLAGFALSILSWMEFCVEHCSANKNFHLFDLPFAIVGMSFFGGLFFFHLLSASFERLSELVLWGLSSALGAELMFIWIQKYQIGHWCPVCLSIALAVAIASATAFYQQNQQGHNMKTALKPVAFFVLGFLFAFLGVSQVNEAQAAVNDMKERIAMGNPNSPVEVYIVSDWFCPSCKQIEPLLEKMIPQIKSEAAIYFIDYPIHRRSANFSPYHLAFLVHNKPQYFQARNMLSDLSDKTDSPTDEEVIKAARQKHLSLQELPYVDVKSGMEYFDKIVSQFDLNSTPTIIVFNPRTNKNSKFEGRDEISEEKVLKAIDTLSGRH